jgi:hypothetical protein
VCVWCVCVLFVHLFQDDVEDPDLHIQFSMTLQKVGGHDLSVSVRHVHNFLAVDMSPKTGTE